jgi:hypothetical protein
MLAQSDRREITAREIDERKEEKLLALGPVLEQLNQDVLDPLVEITFQIMRRQGLIPEPPEELRGQPLKVEYISMMHQAQKLVGLAGHERFLTTLSTVQALEPTAIHKFDADQYIDEYSDILTIPPGVIRPDDDVATIRQELARAQQAQAQAQQLQAEAKAAKDLSGAKLDEDNALSRLTLMLVSFDSYAFRVVDQSGERVGSASGFKCALNSDCEVEGNNLLFDSFETASVSSDKTLTKADCGSFQVGLANVSFTLPDSGSVFGCKFQFFNGDGSNLYVNPQADDQMRYITDNLGDGVLSTTRGDTLEIVAVSVDEWAVIGISSLTNWVDADEQ